MNGDDGNGVVEFLHLVALEVDVAASEVDEERFPTASLDPVVPAVDAAMLGKKRKSFPVVSAVGIESELRQVALAKAMTAELKVETEI
ncbi:hypothetical protein TSUD_238670 [Trifolium subterraneum]|uniref:Uncharacterized protein n=1 Tax=Trifolium subterraneum TaxID=3900 RepID=A0A2Z6PTC4_TRISU|nr:hypothetical protein TSUD_238670 [Trifolium subterraneum]